MFYREPAIQREPIKKFWEKYLEKTKRYDVPAKARRWYVKRVEHYIKAHPSNQLAQHSRDTVENYLQALGRNDRIADWQFKQAVDALKILFVDVVVGSDLALNIILFAQSTPMNLLRNMH